MTDKVTDAMRGALETLLAEARERGGALSIGEKLGVEALAMHEAKPDGDAVERCNQCGERDGKHYPTCILAALASPQPVKDKIRY